MADPGLVSQPQEGAHWDGEATTVTVRSSIAQRVELSVISAGESVEWRGDLAQTAGDGDLWSIRTDRLRVGDRYGLRTHGPTCNPRLLLLDPAAQAVSGDLAWDQLDFANDRLDTGPYVPWSVVVDTTFDWRSDVSPHIDTSKRVIYEANVKSLTATHPKVPAQLRGTYLGLAQSAVVDHLLQMGITSLELLPVQQFVTGRALWERGLRNLWGYDPAAWFAPHAAYATSDDGSQVSEFQEMVRLLHAAGIEVILDVVFNHSGEYDRSGPTLVFRGLDDARWYRHHDNGTYEDTTGCRNTIDLRPRPNLALVLASLRHWVKTYHVDGFRFDLATTLLRGDHGVDLDAPFLSAVAADPELAECTLIAEPWDAAADGYHLGGFPAPWLEWNDRFRDDVRDLWRGRPGIRPVLATRLAGSSDVFGPHRRPVASVNFITAHDGFTLVDLVSYEQRRNEANDESGADGSSDNRSWNCGSEGPTDDPAVIATRARQQRNLMATLLVARGTPMITAGDEMGRTQCGNNNAYCQDNEISWIDWERADLDLLAFTTNALTLRSECAEMHANEWLTTQEVTWTDADGELLTEATWATSEDRLLVMALANLVIVVNAGADLRRVRLPAGAAWRVRLDTTTPSGLPAATPGIPAGATIDSQARSVLVLTRD